MKVSILSTGDEIMSGGVVDTNSSFLAAALLSLGLKVDRFVAVGDDLQTMSRTISELARETDFLIVTGGLGPTSDDMTAEAAAGALKVRTVINNEALNLIKAFFAGKGWTMSQSNQKQAMLPEGSLVIDNRVGTAPGFCLSISGCQCFFLPGVPEEMKKMAGEFVLPWIYHHAGLSPDLKPMDLTPETIIVFGLPESEVGELLKDLPRLFPGVRPGFRADFPLIQVKLYPEPGRGVEGKKVLDRAKSFIVDTLGHRVVSLDGLTLQEEVGRLLVQQKATLALAESCTGGLVANMITDVAGSSDYFLFSGVTYSNEAKVRVLGVSQATIDKHGAVSEETAEAMAVGVRRLTRATYGVSTSGIAGPGGATPGKPVGTVCIGVAGPSCCAARRYVFSFENRILNKQMFAVRALGDLRYRMLKETGSA